MRRADYAGDVVNRETCAEHRGEIGNVKERFKFLWPGRLVEGDLELVLTRRLPADRRKPHVPCCSKDDIGASRRTRLHFEMRHPGRKTVLGSIRLRVGSTAVLRYAGHIGYGVYRRFRGHRYASRSCRLLLALARAHGLKAVWLTVHPKNIASQKTCASLGTKYVDTVRIPKTNEMYAQGERYKRQFRVDLR